MENGGSFHKKMWGFPLKMVIYPIENMGYPLVNQHNYGKIHHFQWVNPLFLWPFSIAMFNYQRVNTMLDCFTKWIINVTTIFGARYASFSCRCQA